MKNIWIYSAVLISMNVQASERIDRSVDSAAAMAQEQAITKLKKLVSKHSGAAEEPVFLDRLADSYYQAASLYFRIARGKGSKNHQQALKSSVDQYDRLISRYPDYPTIQHAYFQRAKAWEELGKLTLAHRDYLHVLHHYPDSDESFPSAMALADQEVQANRHAQALSYLAHIEKTPGHPLFPFALYKSAWSNYNLKKHDVSAKYLERHIAYILDKKRVTDQLESADESFLQNSLQDLVMFKLDGYEGMSDPYPVADIYKYFKKTSQGHFFPKMVLRAAKLIRTQGRDRELVQWRDLAENEGFHEVEFLEVQQVVLEHLWNRRQHAQILNGVQKWTAWVKEHPAVEKDPTFKKSVSFLAETAKNYQELTIKNKDHPQAKEFAQIMQTLYLAVSDSLPENDPQAAVTRFNMAETFFAIGDFASATQNYRWIVDRFSKHSTLNLLDIRLRAIASRYEWIKSKNWIPGDLKLASQMNSDVSALPAEIQEWIKWVDEQSAQDHRRLQFMFEANRALYAHGHVASALERMSELVDQEPRSSQAVAASSLVVDSYVNLKNWKLVHEWSRDFLDAQAGYDKVHSKRLQNLAASSWLKLMEEDFNQGRFDEVLSKESKLRKWYSQSDQLIDGLMWLAQASVRVDEPKKAEILYKELLSQNLNPERKAWALSGHAALLEKQGLYLDAAQAYWTNFKQGKKDGFKKAIEYFWIEGQLAKVGSEIDPERCDEKDRSFCRLFTSLYELEKKDGEPELAALAALKNVERGDSRTLWEQLSRLKKLATQWDDLDAQVQYSLLPKLIVASQKGFMQARQQIRDFERLRAAPKYLQNRIDNVLRLEKLAQSFGKLPWMKLKVIALDELAGTYEDFSSELKLLKLQPEDAVEIQKMTASIDQKVVDIRHLLDEMESLNPTLESGVDVIRTSMKDREFLKALDSKQFAKAGFLIQKMPSDAKDRAEVLLWWSVGAQREAQDRILEIVAKR